ncbi:MAG: hypothetical protein P1V35_15885, partial [Planctomycetota bacterium]|nr:hypothetical protein [Planctomycetota bacterium]
EQGQVQLQAQLDLTRLAQPRGTFSIQCSAWSVPEIGRLTARTEGALLDTGIELTSLDAQSGNSTVLRLEQVSVPWPVDGTPWTDSLLPGIQGQVVAGGADLEVWLTRFGGEAPTEGQAWPLGSYLLEAQVIDGVVAVQQARVTLESPNWPAPVMVSAKGSLALDTRRAGETRIDGLLSVGQGKWAPQVGTQLEWPSITGGFAYSGAWPSGSGHFELHPSDWILSSPDQPDVAMNWSGRCDVEQGQIQLKSLLGRFGTAGQSAELPGELTLRGMLASVDQWMQSPSDAPLQLQADLTLHRLAPLRALLPDLRRIEGTAQGQLSMGGSLANPKLRGSVQATADSVRFTWGETLSQVSAHMNWLDSNTGTFGLLGQYGGAPVDIVGNMAMGKGQPTWDATLQTKDFPLLRTPDARIRADGTLLAQGQG